MDYPWEEERREEWRSVVPHDVCGEDEPPEPDVSTGPPAPDSWFERLWMSTVVVLLVVLILAAVWWVFLVPHGTYEPGTGHGCKPTIEYDCLPENPYDYIIGP